MMKIVPCKLFDNVPFGSFPTANTLYVPNQLCDARQALAATIYVTSTLDQAVNLQVVGNDTNDPSSDVSPVFIGGVVLLRAATPTQRVGLTINLNDHRHQYLGITVTTRGNAPAAGRLDAVAYVWEPK